MSISLQNVLGAIVGLLAAVSLFAQEDVMFPTELVGIPIKAVVYGNSQAALARSPQGREGMFYIPYYASTGGELIGYHWATGEHLRVRLGSAGGYGCVLGPDGALYVGGVDPGNMYRYDPATGQLENLGGAQHDVQYIWALAVSPVGKIYGACYPRCNVLEYDIRTKALRDLGRLSETEQYVRSICVDPRGKIWAGVGTHAHLFVLDPETSERRDMLPAEYQRNSFCYELGVSGRYVLATLIPQGVLLVFEAETETLRRVLARPDDSLTWALCRGAAPNEAYLYASPNGDLYHYDIAADRLSLLAQGLGQCAFVTDKRFVHGIDDQDYFLYDLQEKRYIERRRLAEAGEGMAIFTLTAGADGNIYGSTYINQHIFRYEPQTGTFTDLGKVIRVGGQVDSIHCGRDGKIYMGCYILAHLAIYDPTRPWRPGREPDSNPRELGAVGHGQYRTRAIVLGPDNCIYVGTIPSYSSAPTGAFTRWNPATGEHKTWLDLVPGGAVHVLAADERYVYGAGGGVFFVWDPAREQKIYEEKRNVLSLVALSGGIIVGNSDNELFVFNAAETKITKTFPSPIGTLPYMTLAPNGKIYGLNSSAIAEIDPTTWTARKIAAEGGQFLAADRESTLYFARGPRLYRLRTK